MNRRTFLHRAAIGATASLAACRDGLAPVANTLEAASLKSRRVAPTRQVSPGFFSLALDRPRDGFLYVPTGYTPDVPTPLLILLHGAGRDSTEWSLGGVEQVANAPGILVLGPDSRGATWDALSRGGYGPDVAFLDAALARVFDNCNVDAARIALGGFSDGATYALSLGLANGDFFSSVMAFSPGGRVIVGRRGSPKVFVAHGTSDGILPISRTRTDIVPWLSANGYDVDYQEFAGGHEINLEVVSDAAFSFARGAAADGDD